tara:strand:- start:201 stop:533 length:333 start_codon:yes stop_codon:yes gene_type:complete
MSRYIRRLIATNNNDQYFKVFEERGVKKIEQYRTPEVVPADKELIDSVECHFHVWRTGDAYWKLSTNFYGTPDHWWVIASFNKKPTDSHNSIGDVIKIPFSLAEALQVVE